LNTPTSHDQNVNPS